MAGGAIILFVTSGRIKGESATEELVSCKIEDLQYNLRDKCIS